MFKEEHKIKLIKVFTNAILANAQRRNMGISNLLNEEAKTILAADMVMNPKVSRMFGRKEMILTCVDMFVPGTNRLIRIMWNNTYIEDNGLFQFNIDKDDLYIYVNTGKDIKIFKTILSELVKKIITVGEKALDDIGKVCIDCGDPTNGKYNYNGGSYCEQCYNEIIDKCSWCEQKEDSKSIFNSIWIEEDGRQKQVVLCSKCTALTTRCFDGNCRANIKLTTKPCEECGNQYCSSHIVGHRCRGNEPTFLFKRVNLTKLSGDPSKAISIKNNRLVGLELETVNGEPEKLVGKLDHRIGVEHDGSLQGKSPIELVTPPASADILEGLINSTTKALRAAGYRVNKSCGFHIHLDSEDFNTNGDKIFKILATYYVVEPVIFAMLPLSRRDNKYSLPLKYWLDEPKMMKLAGRKIALKDLEMEWYKNRSSDLIRNFKSRKWDSSRYHGLNLHSLFMNGHIEMRYHHGTLNTTKIKNWVNLNLLLVDWALNNYNKNVIDAIFYADKVEQKVRIMVRHMGINREIRRYINRNLRKFATSTEEDDN